MTALKLTLAAAVGVAALVAGAVDWQFTGATNRTSAASAQTVAAALPLRVFTKGGSASGNFESRQTDTKVVHGCNFSSKGIGMTIIVR